VRQGRPKPPSQDPDLAGVYYAIVTQNKDEEKNIARIKVRFPWMDGGDSDQSHWAYLAVPMEGNEFGTYFLPEVDDTVLVMFLHGDIRFPVIIGGCWNEVDTTPEANENGKNDFRLIKSRSGHRLLFDDSSNTKLVLTDKSNANYVGVGSFSEGGDSPNKFTLEAPGQINGSATEGVSICSLEGTVNIWCPKGTLKVEGSHVEFTAGDKAEFNATKDLKIEGGMSGKITASQTLKAKASTVKIN
jgi:hypothetical protein